MRAPAATAAAAPRTYRSRLSVGRRRHRTAAHSNAVPAVKASPSLRAQREVRVPLGHEGDDRRGSQPDATFAGQFRSQQVRETDTDRRQRRVRQAHQQQAAVRTIGGLGEPDQRRRQDVVERRVVGHPHPGVTSSAGSRSFRLPLPGAVWHGRLSIDLGKAKLGDLVGVAEVRLLIRVVERRLLEREHRRDADEGDHHPDQTDDRRGHPTARRD